MLNFWIVGTGFALGILVMIDILINTLWFFLIKFTDLKTIKTSWLSRWSVTLGWLSALTLFSFYVALHYFLQEWSIVFAAACFFLAGIFLSIVAIMFGSMTFIDKVHSVRSSWGLTLGIITLVITTWALFTLGSGTFFCKRNDYPQSLHSKICLFTIPGIFLQ
jgi:hypothetical protein